MKKIRALFLDVENAKKFETIDIVDYYEEYLKKMRIDTLDIVRRNIAGKPYQIVIDDCGALYKDRVCSCEDFQGYPALFGNIIITGLANDEGELTSLTLKDIEKITGKLVKRFSFVLGKQYYRVRLSK